MPELRPNEMYPKRQRTKGRPKSAPRWFTPEKKNSARWWLQVEGAADRIGIKFMPHQKQILRVVTELDKAHGVPRWPQVLVTIPRQQGKTWTIRPLMLAKALEYPGSTIYYTAQTRQAARARLLEAGRSYIESGVDIKMRVGLGSEALIFPNGSIIEPIAPTEQSGHGASIDLLIIDEMWAVSPQALGALIPALSARPGSQMVAISTMGTVESEVLNSMVARGREGDDRLAYFEWSIPDDKDPYDEDEWWRAMPALGRTVGVQNVRDAASILTRSEFVRAFANRQTMMVEPIVPQSWWDDAADATQAPPKGLTLAVEINVGPSGASIGAAWNRKDDEYHLELVDYKSGQSISWIAPRLAELIHTFQPAAVAIDPGGPAASVFDEIRSLCERTGTTLRKMPPRDTAAAAGYWYDSLAQARLTHGISDELDTAIAGAAKKNLGDLWVFSRPRSIGDVSPLIAVVAALYVARERGLTPQGGIF